LLLAPGPAAAAAVCAGRGPVDVEAVSRRPLSLRRPRRRAARRGASGIPGAPAAAFARPPQGEGPGVSTRIGIVGVPSAGKSSLFSARPRAGAEAASYPFTTIEPNVAVLPVRDERLEAVARTVRAGEIVWDTVDFHDIAGLVAGAHRGEGLGNRFLANIRETDAIVHVVRAHADDSVVPPEGRGRPPEGVRTRQGAA